MLKSRCIYGHVKELFSLQVGLHGQPEGKHRDKEVDLFLGRFVYIYIYIYIYVEQQLGGWVDRGGKLEWMHKSEWGEFFYGHVDS